MIDLTTVDWRRMHRLRLIFMAISLVGFLSAIALLVVIAQ